MTGWALGRVDAGGSRLTPDPGSAGRGPSSPGVLRAGTSGFAYPAWRGTFYPDDLRQEAFLGYYASQFSACELNGTFYARPSPRSIARWRGATPPDFRFIVKAQRGGALRALYATPAESVAWLTEPLGGFGERLGAVLFRVPREARRRGPEDDARLSAILSAWPSTIPLVVELHDRSWQIDETYAALRSVGASLCRTDVDGDDDPLPIRLTGSFVYLRLRRETYTEEDLAAWAARIAPFVLAGSDAWAFFRHDETGASTQHARRLVELTTVELGRQAADGGTAGGVGGDSRGRATEPVVPPRT
ncbi:MAG TPA: DUF72 domain-containing protein [Candidatus Limnocylindrales bacterium]|nr:DUF72 domain-containing protein [Candidatus Limnocylindrales bacterium]